jgi:2',3'-cyclic-nucleotide 2'-phosphodiesterase (5'-nucleotidase family)
VAETGNAAADPQVVEVLGRLGAIIDEKDRNRFGSTTAFLEGRRNFVRTEETNLGNLSAEANLAAARAADPTTSLSLKNGGGIRDAIGQVISSSGNEPPRLGPPAANPRVGKREGEVSQLDIENALRFNNGLTLLTLTAQQLRDTIEWSVAGTTPTGTPGQFPQVAGMAFSFDPTRTAMTYTRDANNQPVAINNPGQRLRNLVARRSDGTLDLVVEDGQLVGDPNRTFRLVTLDFLANGGDAYLPLTQAANRVDLPPAGEPRTFNTPGTEQRALADYLQAIGLYTVAETPRALDRRIQHLGSRADDVLAPEWVGLSRLAGGIEWLLQTLPGKQYGFEAAPQVNGPWADTGLNLPGTGGIVPVQTPNPDAAGFLRARLLP